MKIEDEKLLKKIESAVRTEKCTHDWVHLLSDVERYCIKCKEEEVLAWIPKDLIEIDLKISTYNKKKENQNAQRT